MSVLYNYTLKAVKSIPASLTVYLYVYISKANDLEHLTRQKCSIHVP